jgi:hypothetical protein
MEPIMQNTKIIFLFMLTMLSSCSFRLIPTEVALILKESSQREDYCDKIEVSLISSSNGLSYFSNMNSKVVYFAFFKPEIHHEDQIAGLTEINVICTDSALNKYSVVKPYKYELSQPFVLGFSDFTKM